MIRRLAIPTLCLALAGCGVQGTSAPEFDLTLTKANFTDECANPIVLDETFCLQVDIDDMTATGTTLIVPTGLNPAAAARAEVICGDVARVSFDAATGEALGYERIEVLDMEGDVAATCRVR
jgi:hypothetical protein